MTVQLPNIDITFKQQAFSFVTRSARGNVLLIVKDDTDNTFITKEYKLITEVEKDVALFTAPNLQYIKDCMLGLPNKVTVIRIDVLGLIADALDIAEGYNTGWVGIADGIKTDMDALATWTKQIRLAKKTFKAIIFAPTTPSNDEGVVELGNAEVTFSDARGTATSDKFIPTLLGYLAGCNVEKGTTYLNMANLSATTPLSDIDINLQLNLGKLMLINDEGAVKIGLGINSLTTFTVDKTADLQLIEVVEATDLMLDDIRKTFKNDFIGKYKNNVDNQMIFISAVNGYLKTLAEDDILDINFDNVSFIDVSAQKAAWVIVNPLAIEWDEATVKNTAYRNQMFLAGQIKILQSITGLNFVINMQ